MFTTQTVERLQKKSASCIAQFAKTIADLNATNTEIQKEIIDREELQQDLEDEKIALKKILDVNLALINRLSVIAV